MNLAYCARAENLLVLVSGPSRGQVGDSNSPQPPRASTACQLTQAAGRSHRMSAAITDEYVRPEAMSEATPPVPNSDIQIRFDSVFAATLSALRPLVSASGPYMCVLICPRQAGGEPVRPRRAGVKRGLEPSGTLTLVPMALILT